MKRTILISLFLILSSLGCAREPGPIEKIGKSIDDLTSGLQDAQDEYGTSREEAARERRKRERREQELRDRDDDRYDDDYYDDAYDRHDDQDEFRDRRNRRDRDTF